MNFGYKKQGDHVYSWRKQWTLDNPVRGMMHPPKKLFGHMVEPGMTVVDTGCGTGFFTMALARMVGNTGTVVGVDIQAGALNRLNEKAAMAGLSGIIKTMESRADDMGELPIADFALAAYMVHEVPDIDTYFLQMSRCVRPGGRLLLLEPKFHVSPAHFDTEMSASVSAGFVRESSPNIFLSHAAVLKKS
ncbi:MULTISPECIES: methyltransferase domain-containing protein [unclassified Pseudodesulfovibrio]|uniref:class I SAM-dependent methyltransferase n=1 Tax=unclassified Pseudodesulfovibrio TaxID=2661612 RepID=UPI0013E301A7|nr:MULTISPECIES: methyltransferase domain-containing protein [unclassified Pseudodesulfovibrio]MCJ2164938.1 methyltransferase domain-containing protein [Pseudodesulfovibrio sp. S3-i]